MTVVHTLDQLTYTMSASTVARAIDKFVAADDTKRASILAAALACNPKLHMKLQFKLLARSVFCFLDFAPGLGFTIKRN